MKNNNLLGLILPTNDPMSIRKYLLPSLVNIKELIPYSTILVNYQKPYTEEEMRRVTNEIINLGFECRTRYSEYNVPAFGHIPMNAIREDTAALAPECKYFMFIDDDLSFRGSSAKMPRTSGIQILQCLIYLLKYSNCGIMVLGGNLIKKIKKDTIAPIPYNRDYVTGRGLIFKNHSPSQGLLVPREALQLYGSDEEKVAAAYRVSCGLYTAELPFVRIMHCENQKSLKNKNGKIPGYDLYKWNTDDIRDKNNFKFIRDNYNPEYKFGKGNIIHPDNYIGPKTWETPEEFTMDFRTLTDDDIVSMINDMMELEGDKNENISSY